MKTFKINCSKHWPYYELDIARSKEEFIERTEGWKGCVLDLDTVVEIEPGKITDELDAGPKVARTELDFERNDYFVSMGFTLNTIAQDENDAIRQAREFLLNLSSNANGEEFINEFRVIDIKNGKAPKTFRLFPKK
jgi:hypothetical protein